MKKESILTGEWTPCCPNPELSPIFLKESGSLEVMTGTEGRVFGYLERCVEASKGAYYCLDVLFSVSGEVNLSRSMLALVVWEQGREKGVRPAQEIMSEFFAEGEMVRGRLICRAPKNTHSARIQLGLRYASNAKIVFSEVTWAEASKPKTRKAGIGVCNWNPATAESKDAYLEKLGQLLSRAGEGGCDLMLLPEFCDTYQWKNNFLHVGPIEENLTISTVSDNARKYSMYVVAPIVERDGDCVFNTSVLIGRNGDIIGKYRKTHLYWPEAFFWGLTPGDEFPVFELDFGIVGIQTCYDNWNADVCKLLALKGAELILMPNEGYDPMIMPARAVDNRICLAVSSLAFEGAVYNAKGEKVTSTADADLQIGVIDLSERIPPFPVSGGSCNYAMGARRCVHNSLSERVYQELLNEICKWQNVNESFIDPRGDISGELNR